MTQVVSKVMRWMRWKAVEARAKRRGVDPYNDLMDHLEQREGVRNSTIYMNTPEEAERIGWARVPEYVHGDKSAPYVEHDHGRGLFFYRFAFVCGRCGIKGVASGHLCESCGLDV